MPKRRYTKRRINKRRYRRKRRVPRNIGPLIPNSRIVKLRYVDDGVLDCGASNVPYILNWWCNSLYDPYAGTGGHQPMGFDQMSLMYGHYTVIGAKITVKFMPTDTTNLGNSTVGIKISGTQDTYSAIPLLLEQPNVSYVHLGSLGSGGKTLTKYFSAKKFFGQRVLSEKYSGTPSTDPVEGAFFQVFQCNPNSNLSQDPSPVYINVKIDYIAVFREPVKMSGS